jgi:hypothetical protein
MRESSHSLKRMDTRLRGYDEFTGALTAAIIVAAVRGVEVRILAPKRSDSRLATAAVRSYYDELATLLPLLARLRPLLRKLVPAGPSRPSMTFRASSIFFSSATRSASWRTFKAVISGSLRTPSRFTHPTMMITPADRFPRRR